MRTVKLLLVFVIVFVGVACTQASANDPAAGDLEIVVGDFDAAGMAEVTVTVMSPSSGDAQLFLDAVTPYGTLAQEEWNLNMEARVPQTVTTTIQVDETMPVGSGFSLHGNFMDVKSYVHQDYVSIYIWPDGPSTKRPDESFPTPRPLEIREVTPSPSPF